MVVGRARVVLDLTSILPFMSRVIVRSRGCWVAADSRLEYNSKFYAWLLNAYIGPTRLHVSIATYHPKGGIRNCGLRRQRTVGSLGAKFDRMAANTALCPCQSAPSVRTPFVI